MSRSQLVPSGWYTDETHPGLQRWWDGSDWTPVVAAGPANRQSPIRFEHLKPVVATANRWTPWALASICLTLVLTLVSKWFTSDQIHASAEWLRLMTTKPNASQQEINTAFAGYSSAFGISMLLIIPSIAFTIVMAMWLMQTAKAARALGIRQRYAAPWAFAYFVPIANLFIPFQLMQDLFEKGSRERRFVTIFWIFSLTFAVVNIGIFIVSMINHWTVLSLVTSLMAALAHAIFSVVIVARARRVHNELLAGYLDSVEHAEVRATSV